MPKIVVLDGFTANPGDLSWGPLEAVGECVIHERTRPEETVPRAAGAEIVLTNKVVLDRRAIEALPDLRYIGVLATGYNVVDVSAARERGIIVTNVRAYSTRSVAQTTFALLLELTHHAGHHDREVHAGRWARSPDFCFWDRPLVELDGLTLGVVGLGAIGSAVAAIGQAFGMQVQAHVRRPQAKAGIALCGLDELFASSDVVSLHCPLTDETRHLVNAARLGLMKSSAFLINTGRGPLIDEQALAEALNAGRLAGAGLDVLSVEPPRADHPLLLARNCIVTPHLAWATRAARERLIRAAAGNVGAFLAGRPVNVVS